MGRIKSFGQFLNESEKSYELSDNFENVWGTSIVSDQKEAFKATMHGHVSDGSLEAISKFDDEKWNAFIYDIEQKLAEEPEGNQGIDDETIVTVVKNMIYQHGIKA